ncbi:MAG: hypothetical protein HZA14_00110 [Nitrospirae bacterium]|nr:hypothetical protein [Nitrospirota bacterium]
MKTAFIDWAENKLNLYVFEDNRHIDTLSVTVEGELTTSSLAPLFKPGMQQIYLSIPSSFLTLREMSFPFSDKDKIRDTISYELEGLLLGSVGDYSIDHIITEASESGCKVLAVCIEKTRLKELIDAFTAAGLEPKTITSLDLRLSGGKSEKLLEGLSFDDAARAEAVGEEIINPSLNLRRDELAYTGDLERLKKGLRLTGSLLLILLLILGAHAGFKFINKKKENRMFAQELQTVYRGVFPEDKKIIDPVRQFKGNLNLLKEKKSALGGIPVLDVLNNAANLKPGEIILNELSADGKNLILKGTASSFEEVDSFKNALASSFDGVKVVNSDATVDKKINFTIVMQEKTA